MEGQFCLVIFHFVFLFSVLARKMWFQLLCFAILKYTARTRQKVDNGKMKGTLVKLTVYKTKTIEPKPKKHLSGAMLEVANELASIGDLLSRRYSWSMAWM